MMRQIGIRAKVTVFVSCLIVGIIAVNAVITIRTERGERERQLVEQARLFARLTAADVARSYGQTGPLAGPPDIAYSGIHPQSGEGGVEMRLARFFSYLPDLTRLSIISRNGLVLYDSAEGGAAGPGRARLTDAGLAKRLELDYMDVVRFTDPSGENFIDILAPVTEAGGPQFLKVRYIVSFRSLDARLSAIRNEFIALAGFFIAVGIIGAALFSRRFTKPLIDLKTGAGEIARGNLDYVVKAEGSDEIGELSASFNRMARSLGQHRHELEEAKSELVRSERMAAVGELAAGLSHEIDNPIGVILGFAELLLEDMPEDDPRHEDLSQIVEESKRCKRIVRGLLDFSRPPVLGVIPTDVSEVARRTADAARSQRLFKRVVITTELAEGLPVLQADPDRLKQVFMNLMINAAQAMPDGGGIKVSTGYDAAAGGIRVVFEDTGPGIPEEELKRVFEPFFTTKRPGEGTGLGLAICVRLLEEHGGRIEAESGPGMGARFFVTLPVTSPTVAP